MDFDERLTKRRQPHRSEVCGGVWRRQWRGGFLCTAISPTSPQGFPPFSASLPLPTAATCTATSKENVQGFFSVSSSTRWLNMGKVGCDRNARRCSSNKRRQHQWCYWSGCRPQLCAFQAWGVRGWIIDRCSGGGRSAWVYVMRLSVGNQPVAQWLVNSFIYDFFFLPFTTVSLA